MQADGKIVVGGNFSAIGGQARSFIARLDPITGLADSFDPNADGVVNSIALQSDGLILVGGDFTFIGGQARNFIARLNPTAGLADSFDPVANAEVLSIALQADGKILVGGVFTDIGGQPRSRIARLNPQNGHADNFAPDANNSVESIAVQSDGKILAGGRFISIGGQTRNRIARLDPITGNADSFNPSANNSVESIALQADGKILTGGVFTIIGGQTRSRIARLDPTTGLADSFNPNANNDVLSIAVEPDGKILAGGYFTTIGGGTNDFLERLTNDGAALQNLAVTQNTITWTQSGTGPQFIRVTFEYSTDSVNYTLLGSGTFSGSNWTLTGLSLPLGQNFFVRARGYHRHSHHDGSGSITESVRNAFLSGATPTPTATPVPTCPPVITQSSTQNITVGNSASCNNGTTHNDNSYWRAFDMTTLTTGTQYNVNSVSFGVESANVTQSVTVRLYTTTNFPTGFPSSLALIGTTSLNVTSAQGGTVVTTPLVATVPAGTFQLVMELFTPSGVVRVTCSLLARTATRKAERAILVRRAVSFQRRLTRRRSVLQTCTLCLM